MLLKRKNRVKVNGTNTWIFFIAEVESDSCFYLYQI